MTQQKAQKLQDYYTACQVAAPILRDADPHPGKMTKREEEAQISIVSAWCDFEEACIKADNSD